ncbi:MAG: 50S ribosomal protein L23 [Patescibacteria group bacterium]|jgi:large subunit ribosomal protein L23
MGIFSSKNSKKETREAKPKSAKATEEVLTPASQQAGAAKADVAKASKGQAGLSYRILHSPRVSEKAAVLSSHDVYVINVPVDANKLEIARAVKDLYGVKVEAVRTARGIGKKLKRGRVTGQRNRWKKAYVTIKKGQKIDLYEGV